MFASLNWAGWLGLLATVVIVGVPLFCLIGYLTDYGDGWFDGQLSSKKDGK